MNRKIKPLTHYPGVRNLILLLKKVSLPGFDNLPLYDVLVFFRNEIKRDVISVRAKSIAFTFFMALFPGLLFLFTLIPYIPVPNLQANLINLISEMLPAEAFRMLENTLMGVISQQRGELLSISLFTSLFLATNGMMAVMESFDKSYATFIKRSGLKKRWVAFKLTLVLIFVLMISMGAIVAGNRLLRLLLQTFDILTPFNYLLFSTLKWVVILLLLFVSISLIYYYGPAVKKKFRFISPGSTVATLLVIFVSLGFSYFVNNFGQYNRIYGSIGAIIALQIFIYLNSFALLIGFELNAAITISKSIRKHSPLENIQDAGM
ncbi:MAG: hypothetical protein KatS3mg031_0038 [Chitinophagales bacterium]|nr:MAG: hypothetical protein KatS3mg031_0038 [Chitinophagales bacterium]